MLSNYSSFIKEEFTKEDKDFIKEISDYFTISVEYELVADFDLEDEPFLESDEEVERALNFVKDQTLLDMSRGKIGYRFDDNYKLPKSKLEENEKRMIEENDISKLGKKSLKELHQKYVTWTWVNSFIDFLISKIDPYDEEKTDRKLNKAWETDIDDYIATLVLKNSDMFVFGQNMGFLIDKLKEHMPNFYEKYNKDFKYEIESDYDKPRILEFSSKTYLRGLNECFTQIDDFYEDFNKQDFWKMDKDRTALHVNIGITDKKLSWNPLKGLIIMSDMNRDKKSPFVFTDMMWRANNRFTQSLLDGIRRNLTGEIKKDYKTRDQNILWNIGFRHKERLATHKDYLLKNIDKMDAHDVRGCENFLNPFLIKANKDFYIKEFGIKLVELDYDPGYVEFRYVGGVINKDLFKDKILYFCYIIYLMTNDEYKQKQYQKRLYKYLEDIKEIIQDEIPKYNEGVEWYSKGKFVPDENHIEKKHQFELEVGEIISFEDNSLEWWDGQKWRSPGKDTYTVEEKKLSTEIIDRKNVPPENGVYYYKFRGTWPWFRISDEEGIRRRRKIIFPINDHIHVGK